MIYTDLEDSLYTVYSTMFPDERFTFPFENAPELETPYVIIDVYKIDAVGREQSSSLSTDGVVTVLQTYEVKVRIEVLGEYDNSTVVGNLAHSLEYIIRTPLFYQGLASNKLSLMRYRPFERFPIKRDTKTYMCYKQDLYFAYAVTETQDVGYMDSAIINGVYNDAGREGHVIETQITIPENP